MFDLPKKRVVLSSLIALGYFSLSSANAQFQDGLCNQGKGVASECHSMVKIEKLRPLIYLEKDD